MASHKPGHMQQNQNLIIGTRWQVEPDSHRIESKSLCGSGNAAENPWDKLNLVDGQWRDALKK